MPTREEQWYEIATREVAEKNLIPAIWGKAFSEALGDSQLALALYIKLRVEQLEREYQETLYSVTCPACNRFVKPKKTEHDFLLHSFLGKPRYTWTCPDCKSVVPAPKKW